MSKDMIKELYYGKIVPSNSMVYKTKEYIEACDEFCRLNNLLKSSLDNKQTEIFDNIIEAKDTMTDELIFGAFKEGFKIAMVLTDEGLKPNSEQDEA